MDHRSVVFGFWGEEAGDITAMVAMVLVEGRGARVIISSCSTLMFSLAATDEELYWALWGDFFPEKTSLNTSEEKYWHKVLTYKPITFEFSSNGAVYEKINRSINDQSKMVCTCDTQIPGWSHHPSPASWIKWEIIIHFLYECYIYYCICICILFVYLIMSEVNTHSWTVRITLGT